METATKTVDGIVSPEHCTVLHSHIQRENQPSSSKRSINGQQRTIQSVRVTRQVHIGYDY